MKSSFLQGRSAYMGAGCIQFAVFDIVYGVGQAQNNEVLTIAASLPHAEILELLNPILAKQGVDLKIKVFTDYR